MVVANSCPNKWSKVTVTQCALDKSRVDGTTPGKQWYGHLGDLNLVSGNFASERASSMENPRMGRRATPLERDALRLNLSNVRSVTLCVVRWIDIALWKYLATGRSLDVVDANSTQFLMVLPVPSPALC